MNHPLIVCFEVFDRQNPKSSTGTSLQILVHNQSQYFGFSQNITERQKKATFNKFKIYLYVHSSNKIDSSCDCVSSKQKEICSFTKPQYKIALNELCGIDKLNKNKREHHNLFELSSPLLLFFRYRNCYVVNVYIPKLSLVKQNTKQRVNRSKFAKIDQIKLMTSSHLKSREENKTPNANHPIENWN